MATATLCTPPSICGTKRLHLFDDDDNYDYNPSPFTKKRRFTPPGLERLQAKFPSMEVAVLELALEECGGNIDAAIYHLCRLSLQEEEEETASKPDPTSPGRKTDSSVGSGTQQWAELLVTEMTKATSVDDARSRAAKLLEVVEKAVVEKNESSGGGGLRKKVEVLGKENALLKRAVAILYERQKDQKEKEAESVALRKLVAEYHQKLKTLEANNFALSMHLNRALCGGGSISGHCRPDVF